MKKAIVLITALFMVNAVLGQAYIITYLKGNVYHDHKLVKLHDKLEGLSQLTSNDKTAELALFNAQKGKFRLSFVNSKPVEASQTAKGSELYQIIVTNYVQPYTTEKTLTSRGDFDLASFFTANVAINGSKILLLDGELLPITPKNLKANSSDKFFMCTLKGTDTLCNLITRNKSYLIFDRLVFKGFPENADSAGQAPLSCFIKRGYMADGKYSEEIFSGPINITFLKKEELRGLVSAFREGLTSYYQNDVNSMITDIESQLTYYYGKLF